MDTIDQIIIGWFNSGFGTKSQGLMILGNLVLVTLSLLLSAVFSGIIGFEREYHGHAAGLRTPPFGRNRLLPHHDYLGLWLRLLGLDLYRLFWRGRFFA
jgi:hypothetical protein